jgi:hypothetical protein
VLEVVLSTRVFWRQTFLDVSIDGDRFYRVGGGLARIPLRVDPKVGNLTDTAECDDLFGHGVQCRTHLGPVVRPSHRLRVPANLTITDLRVSPLAVVSAWGFEYKTVAFNWVKLNKRAKSDTAYFMGGGYWTRANPELCLLATRGRPKRLSRSVRRLVVDRLREHSRKPDVVRDRIEKLVAGPYLELFARETKEGWAGWGDQVGLFDQGPVETRKWSSSSRVTQMPPLVEGLRPEPSTRI